MKRLGLLSMTMIAVLLSGCGQSDAELAQARKDVEDLKVRVATLEGQMQTLAASLPEDASLKDAPPASAASDESGGS